MVAEEHVQRTSHDRVPCLFIGLKQKLAKAALPGHRQLTKNILGSRPRGSYLSFGLSLAPGFQSEKDPLLLTWSENRLI